MSDSRPTEEALRWYAGLLLEISPIDDATWDYDVDLRELTKSGDCTLDITDDMMEEMKTRLWALPLETVQTDADAGDPWMRIELALRYACGCTVPLDLDRAAEIVREVCRTESIRDWEGYVYAAAERFDAWIKFFGVYCHEKVTDRELKLDMIYWAARRIGRAMWYERLPAWNAASAPLCPIDLRVAEALAIHLDEDDFVGRELDPAFDDRLQDFKLAWIDYQIRAKVRLRHGPRAKVCARAGCGGRGTDTEPLRRCAGKCPAEHKPMYCSKQCQTKDWKMHKKYCAEGAGGLPEKTAKRGRFDNVQILPLSAMKKKSA